MAFHGGCVQYLQTKPTQREEERTERDAAGRKMLRMYSKQLQIKGRNSCVYFAEVRNDPDLPPPGFWLQVGRHSEDYQLLRFKVQFAPNNP